MRLYRHILLILFLFTAVSTADFSSSDFNHDGRVDTQDLLRLNSLWLNDCCFLPCDETDINRDGLVNIEDFATLADYWQTEDSPAMEIAHWSFDEGTALTAYDSTSPAHNAEMRNMNGYSWCAGQRGFALNFEGDDYLSITEAAQGLGQYFVRDFSISVWLKQGIQSHWQTVIGIESTSRYTDYGFEGFTIELEEGVPLVYIAYADDTREVVRTSRALQAGAWEHFAVVRQGPLVSIYLNGKRDSTHTITSANIKFDSAWPGCDVIGATNDSSFGPTTFYRGKLDDIHLYNFAISEELVTKLARQNHAWLPSPDDGEADIAIDTDLSWQKGFTTQTYDCHDVYLGQVYNDVAQANPSTAGTYKGRQTAICYDPPTDLYPDQTYYWRIDSICDGTAQAGPVWQFDTTAGSYTTSSSSNQTYYRANGAYGHDRFSFDQLYCWKGASGAGAWWWQIAFNEPRQVGSILHIFGDHDSLFLNTPGSYVWKHSSDGANWQTLNETSVVGNTRMYRINRLDESVTARFFRLEITSATGSYPVLREVEFYPETDSAIEFPDWLVAVDITESSAMPGPALGFITLARQCDGWEDAPVQEVWLGYFNMDYVSTEPYPTCAFLSGSYLEWCQRSRWPFAGLQAVVENGNLPIWGSCGGAQALGILLDTGYESPWDCPRCRDQYNPYCPIYGHIGYLDPENPGPCGDYASAIREVGPTYVMQVTYDTVFDGLPTNFLANESHMGQLEYLPVGWHLIAQNGPGGYTQHQCFRQDDRYIYGAQFHIEDYNSQTWYNSQIIMTNFLNLARQWGGYQP